MINSFIAFNYRNSLVLAVLSLQLQFSIGCESTSAVTAVPSRNRKTFSVLIEYNTYVASVHRLLILYVGIAYRRELSAYLHHTWRLLMPFSYFQRFVEKKNYKKKNGKSGGSEEKLSKWSL